MAKKLSELFEEAQRRHVELAALRAGPSDLMEVFEQYSVCLNAAPDDFGVLFYTGSVMQQMGHNGVAMALLRRSLELKETPEAWNNLGSCYKAEFMHEQAEQCWRKAIELKPTDSNYHSNIATLYINEGMPERGEEPARKAIELDPMNYNAHWNLSLILLEQGKWREGLIKYESGLKTGDRQVRFYDSDRQIPEWKGEDLTDKTIVVYGEQGMGDEIMYASALPDLIATGAKVIYDCHPRLYKVMKRSFPGLEAIYSTRKSRTLEWPPDHKIDYRVAIGSLFRRFRLDGQFPRKPYLVPDPELVEEYKQWLEAAGPGPHVGFGWAGGSKRTHSSARSLQLTPMLPVLGQQATFISLQYTPEADEKVKRFYEDKGIRIHHWPEVVRGFDYDHTIALIAALDLVVAINTTAVHVCGAIGKDCWTLTPDRCAWRYASGDSHMAMYGDHVVQFHEAGDMPRAIQSVADALSNLINGAAPREVS